MPRPYRSCRIGLAQRSTGSREQVKKTASFIASILKKSQSCSQSCLDHARRKRGIRKQHRRSKTRLTKEGPT